MSIPHRQGTTPFSQQYQPIKKRERLLLVSIPHRQGTTLQKKKLGEETGLSTNIVSIPHRQGTTYNHCRIVGEVKEKCQFLIGKVQRN